MGCCSVASVTRSERVGPLGYLPYSDQDVYGLGTYSDSCHPSFGETKLRRTAAHRRPLFLLLIDRSRHETG
eukprot:scaffold63404_cov35-Tisochrysis_lutea.AAC.1